MKYFLLILLAIIVLGICFLIIYLKVKARRLARSMFGTDSLIEGYNNQKKKLAEEPKSVCGMTRIYLPMIEKDFPEFNYNEFKAKCENMLDSAFESISSENADLLKDASPSLKSGVELTIDENKRQEVKEIFDNVNIHRTEITGYKKSSGTCVITLQSSVGYYHYKEHDGKAIDGSKDLKEQCLYNTEIVYVQDVSKLDSKSQTSFVGAVCPNCGAPITNLGLKVCQYCGSAIQTININVWIINKYVKL